MGELSQTCMLSRLPIEVGDPVRVLLLTENPYKLRVNHSPTGKWFPRTFPISGTYGGHGRIENFNVGHETLIWCTLLDKDIRKRGTGDNPLQDPPTHRGMGIREILEAAYTNRLKVTYRQGARPLNYLKKALPEACPTIQRVEKLIATTKHQCHVDMRNFGVVRVRMKNYYVGQPLEALKEIAMLGKKAKYPTMIRAGMYNHPEVIFATPPYTERYGFCRSHREHRLRVRSTFIREDIWRYLATEALKDDNIRKRVKKAWDISVQSKKGAALEDTLEENLHEAFNLTSEIYKPGWAEHWNAMVALHKKRPLSNLEVVGWQRKVSETFALNTSMFWLHLEWKPSDPIGADLGKWAELSRFYAEISRIAKARTRK